MNRTTQHEFAPEEVMAYLDGELEPGRASQLALHLQNCEECAGVGTQFRQMSERLLDFEVGSTPEILNALIESLLSDTGVEKARSGQSKLPATRLWRLGFASPYTWALAGVLILALIGRFGFPNLMRVGSKMHEVSSLSSKDLSVSTFMAKGTSRSESVPADTADAPRFAYTQIGRAGGGGNGSAADDETAAASSLSAPLPSGPMIAQTASFTIVASNYDEANASINRLASSHGGYVQRLNAEARAGAPRELSATLRVTAAQLGDTIAQLRKLGRVEQETRANDEVTDQYVDLQARLKSARATEQRLLQLLDTRTGKLEDVLAVEQELARIREEIESMDGQRTMVLHRVNYVTVEVRLREDYREQLHPASASTKTGLRNSLIEGIGNLEDGIVSVLVFLFAYGPSILFWCALFLVPGFFIWRWVRSRSD